MGGDLSLHFLSPSVDSERRPHRSQISQGSAQRVQSGHSSQRMQQRAQRRMQFVAQSSSPPNVPSYGRRLSREDRRGGSAQLGPIHSSPYLQTNSDDSPWMRHNPAASANSSGLQLNFTLDHDPAAALNQSVVSGQSGQSRSDSISFLPSSNQLNQAPPDDFAATSRNVPDSVTSSMMNQMQSASSSLSLHRNTMIGGLSYDDSEPSVIPTRRDMQRGP